MEIEKTRMPMWRHMVLTPIGMLIQEPHITSELNKLTTHDKYRDCVHTAVGTGMSINHVGHSILCTPDSSIQLKNILHVPHASKSLH
jgi:hypothetical protein